MRLLTRDWDSRLSNLLGSARSHVIICAPFVSPIGTDFVVANLPDPAALTGESRIVTDLSPAAMCDGATDPTAVLRLLDHFHGSVLSNLRRLHAKVYIADRARAIVTSANLTRGGLTHNFECGVELDDPAVVSRLSDEVLAYADLGARIERPVLEKVCEVAAELRAAAAKEKQQRNAAAGRALRKVLAEAESQLARAWTGGGAIHTVFARTIMYLVARRGPMTTKQIHQSIAELHPDLCNDSIDRIIDGKHFGKKWKHAVRSAQQQLKKQGRLVLLPAGRWGLPA